MNTFFSSAIDKDIEKMQQIVFSLLEGVKSGVITLELLKILHNHEPYQRDLLQLGFSKKALEGIFDKLEGHAKQAAVNRGFPLTCKVEAGIDILKNNYPDPDNAAATCAIALRC